MQFFLAIASNSQLNSERLGKVSQSQFILWFMTPSSAHLPEISPPFVLAPQI